MRRFAKDELKTYMDRGVTTYFLDEAVYASTCYQDKEFAGKRWNIEVGMKDYNMQCTAFIGAIAKDRGLFLWETYKKSVTTEKFIKFLRKLKRKHGPSEFALYLDNLKCHTCNAAKEAYRELGIIPIFSPIYDPTVNSIEYMLSHHKRFVARLRLQDMSKNQKKTFP